jgi:2-C-methyl-D-erythritol 4-phosphate cytidylyltransferase
VSAPATDVEALVLAAGQGTRLGLGPKAFVVLAGETLLERAVSTVLGAAASAIVAVPEAELARAQRAVGGRAVRVIAGGARRIDTTRALLRAASAPWLLLHDVVHPMVTVELARRVIDEARRSGAAAATLPNVDFLYGTDGTLRAAPGDVVTVQKPLAFRRADLERGFAAAEASAAGGRVPDVAALEILAHAGRRFACVPGSIMNFKLTIADDLELARRLLAAR